MTVPDQPLAADVIASGIHDAKNGMFDALARIGIATQAIRGDRAAAALPALAEAERAVATSAERLTKLLSAYRLLRHEDPVSMLPVDIRDLLEDAVIRAGGGDSGDAVITTACGCDGFWICDRELIADCLVNALRNARRHARRAIHLGATEVDGQLLLGVADDGPGFPDAPPAHADGTRSGVGLFIARRIAELHRRHGRHGRLRLYNGGALGGAVFELWLP
jgi:signal transduction histidine kinase